MNDFEHQFIFTNTRKKAILSLLQVSNWNSMKCQIVRREYQCGCMNRRACWELEFKSQAIASTTLASDRYALSYNWVMEWPRRCHPRVSRATESTISMLWGPSQNVFLDLVCKEVNAVLREQEAYQKSQPQESWQRGLHSVHQRGQHCYQRSPHIACMQNQRSEPNLSILNAM